MTRVLAQRRRLQQLLLTLLVLSTPLLLAHGRVKAIDYNALEKAWEAGDADEELRSEGDEHYRQLSEKNEEEARALGPQMIFVTLKDGSERPRELLADVASRWKEMLWNGGVEVNVYEVVESKLLIGLQKGVFVRDVQQFLKEQREVKEYEWNGKTYSTSTTKEKLHQPHQKKGKHHQRKHGKKASKKSADKGPDNEPPTNKRHRHESHQAGSRADPTTSNTPKQSEPKSEL